jgi:hypothetical protein
VFTPSILVFTRAILEETGGAGRRGRRGARSF